MERKTFDVDEVVSVAGGVRKTADETVQRLREKADRTPGEEAELHVAAGGAAAVGEILRQLVALPPHRSNSAPSSPLAPPVPAITTRAQRMTQAERDEVFRTGTPKEIEDLVDGGLRHRSGVQEGHVRAHLLVIARHFGLATQDDSWGEFEKEFSILVARLVLAERALARLVRRRAGKPLEGMAEAVRLHEELPAPPCPGAPLPPNTASTSSEERLDVLFAFAVEADPAGSLVRYQTEHPALANELAELAKELATPFVEDESPISPEDDAAVDAAVACILKPTAPPEGCRKCGFVTEGLPKLKMCWQCVVGGDTASAPSDAPADEEGMEFGGLRVTPGGTVLFLSPPPGPPVDSTLVPRAALIAAVGSLGRELARTHSLLDVGSMSLSKVACASAHLGAAEAKRQAAEWILGAPCLGALSPRFVADHLLALPFRMESLGPGVAEPKASAET